MKISIVLPRNMHFGPNLATSIDLCAYDYMTNSRYSASICAFHRPIEQGFTDVATCTVSSHKSPIERLLRQTGFEKPIETYDPDLILVEQHLPTAYRLAKYFPTKPVVVRRHGFLKPSETRMHARARHNKLLKLAAVVSVSNAVDQSLVEAVDKPVVPHFVVHNGIDPEEWLPARKKEKLIVFAGRLDPEKGVLEAIKGTNAFLEKNPNWHAKFLCSVSDLDSPYVKMVTENAGLYPKQMEISLNQPIAEVQRAFSKAEISLVPSIFDEPFGRTVIEAMSCKAAVICSATGGMSEVVTPTTARTLSEVSCAAICDEITGLAENNRSIEEMGKAGRARVQDYFHIAKKSEQLDEVLYEAGQNWVDKTKGSAGNRWIK